MNDQPPPPKAPEPDPPEIVKMFDYLPSSMRGQSLVLLGIFVLLLFFTLHLARDILVPIVLALLLNMLLSPLVQRLRRLGIPSPIGAVTVMMTVAGAVIWGGYALSGPAAEWVERAPQSVRQIEYKLRSLKRPVEQVQKATEQVENLAAPPGASPPPKVEVRRFNLGEFLAVSISKLAAQTMVVVFLLFFLLASGDFFMRRLVKALSTGQEKRRAVGIARDIQRDVSAYLSTVTAINIGLGVVTSGAMWAVGLPNPVLWGALMTALNFLPYVGPTVMVAVVGIVGLLTFDSAAQALLPSAIMFAVTSIEGNFLTPYLLGRRLTLHPAVVFLSMVLWGWLWGVPGALLAVPLLVSFKIFADHVEALQGVSIFLGRREEA